MQARLRDRTLEELYRRAVVARTEVPAAMPRYRTLPEPLVAGGFERGISLNVDLFFEFMRSGRAPSPEDTQEVVQIALSRVRDGESLEDVLGRYSMGAEYLWSRLKDTASEPERELLEDAAVSLLRYITLLTTRIAAACVQRAHDPRWELLERRRAIADALLAGRDPIEWADEPAITVPDAFLVAAFRLGTTRSADTGELRHRIESIPGVFLRLDSGGWTALLPLQPGDDGTATLTALTSRLPGPARPTPQPEAPLSRMGPPAPFWVGVATAASHAEVPAVFAEARLLAELGRCLDRPQPVCRRPDLMFEYTVAAGGSARAGLAAVLAPLDSQPLLAETLEVFVDTGFNQLATARLLTIHRNTVTYRLARVHELTGLDPHRPTDAMTLSAARIARRLEIACFAP
ncbi:helix-turn-helix domain-containing protein [Nocardia sp. NPDC004860]|uniref:PucR family transcriptional regulator n=1 Tax=Nocardia sp. NPDC004860 TaxID=3154557 RepID=UPI0033B596C1